MWILGIGKEGMAMHPGVLLAIGGAVLLFLCLLFWPRWGLVSFWRNIHLNTRRTRIEHALKHLFNHEYMQHRTTADTLSVKLSISRRKAEGLLSRMEARGLVKKVEGGYRLTEDGSAYALRIVRAHRLWERYLADETGLHGDEWHRKAERLEHSTTPEELEALAEQLGNPLYDPHGAPIPTADGVIGPPMGQPVTAFTTGDVIIVTRIDKEPELLYSQIVAEGIVPGMQMRILEMSPQRIRFGSQQNEHVLAPVVASRILAISPPEQRGEEIFNETLSSLQMGETGKVIRFAPHCRGNERRRLMDLGIIPGTLIAADLNGPFGDPKAYRVRDTSIALRNDLANLIYIEKVKGAA